MVGTHYDETIRQEVTIQGKVWIFQALQGVPIAKGLHGRWQV
jgi:hypothetical protein